MLPVDNTITDEEREKYGVPSLSHALTEFTKKHQK